MNNLNENQGNRLQYWGPKLLVAVMLIFVGHESPAIWLSISATIWAGYFLSFVTLPFLIAASQNTSLAKIASRTLSVLNNMAIAALISAPIVMFHWYSNR